MKLFLVATVFIFCAIAVPVAHCDYIHMDTRATCVVSNNLAHLTVESTNNGDEEAVNVRFEAMFPGAPRSSRVFQKVDPNSSVVDEFVWECPADLGSGQLVIPVFTHYADVNLYGFSAVSYAMLYYGRPAVATVSGKVLSLRMSRSGDLRVLFHSLDGQEHDLSVRLVVPTEVRVKPAVVSLVVPPEGDAEAVFAISSFSAVPGSVYVVCAVFGEETADGIAENAVIGSIAIDTMRQSLLLRHRRMILIMLGICLAIYSLRQLAGIKKSEL